MSVFSTSCSPKIFAQNRKIPLGIIQNPLQFLSFPSPFFLIVLLLPQTICFHSSFCYLNLKKKPPARFIRKWIWLCFPHYEILSRDNFNKNLIKAFLKFGSASSCWNYLRLSSFVFSKKWLPRHWWAVEFRVNVNEIILQFIRILFQKW